ncbi:hydroxyethylthiazole kinase [Anaerofustis sp.]|uniref:hydroxyethylthiazole kinase n=1 Tax=Anaerofustis sp. TaxID=1872517 RepID=UPI0025C0D7A0|nr:hydroxyethylthiazole kinase [Anaerofustis sp.]
MLKDMLKNVREQAPLIHNITNYVTVNDCANILLALGASPIMSDDKEEVEEITSICSGLNINIGTLNQNTIPSMFLAGKRANELSHPVILDPVGVGASKLRTDTAKELLKNINFTAVKGNISEIKTLAIGKGTTKGVDADISDKVDETNLNEVIDFLEDFSREIEAIVIVTGQIDIVTDGKKSYIIRNGHSVMSSITGTGCMLSAITCAYLAANKDNMLEACLASVCTMGYAGQMAYKKMKETGGGNASFRNYLIDCIFNLNSTELEKGAKYECR